MPLVIAHLPTGHNPAQKHALLEKSTQAVVESLNAPISAIRIMLQEYPEEASMCAGQAGAMQLLYFVYLIEGRSSQLKAALMAALHEAAVSSLGISTDEVRVVIHDMPKTDIGLAGGISAAAAGR